MLDKYAMNAVSVHGGCELLESISRSVGLLTDAGPDVFGIVTLSGLGLRLSSGGADMIVSCGPSSSASHSNTEGLFDELWVLVMERYELFRVTITLKKLCLFPVVVTFSGMNVGGRECGQSLTFGDASLTVRAHGVPS